MDTVHEMLIEDEIVLCGVVVVLGLVTGAITRGIAAFRGRRTVG